MVVRDGHAGFGDEKNPDRPPSCRAFRPPRACPSLCRRTDAVLGVLAAPYVDPPVVARPAFDPGDAQREHARCLRCVRSKAGAIPERGILAVVVRPGSRPNIAAVAQCFPRAKVEVDASNHIAMRVREGVHGRWSARRGAPPISRGPSSSLSAASAGVHRGKGEQDPGTRVGLAAMAGVIGGIAPFLPANCGLLILLHRDGLPQTRRRRCNA